jgi:hypothetical protein
MTLHFPHKSKSVPRVIAQADTTMQLRVKANLERQQRYLRDVKALTESKA